MPWLTIQQVGFDGGMNQRDDKRRLGPTEAQIIENFLLDGNGVLYVPKQDVKFNSSSAGNRIMGLVRHYGTNTSEKRLLVVSGTTIFRATDSSGGLGMILGAWQNTASIVRTLTTRYYTYLFDGASALKAYSSATEGLVNPLPSAPGNSITSSAIHAGPLNGWFAYKITDKNAAGESDAGTASAAVQASGESMLVSGMTAKSGSNKTGVYRTWGSSEDAANHASSPFYWLADTQSPTILDRTPGGAGSAILYENNLMTTTPTYAAPYRDRTIWAKGNTLYISDVMIPTRVILTITVGGSGEIVGLAPLAQMLVIFKPTSIWVLTGYTSSDFAVQPLSEQFGCAAPNSVVEFENYVWWMSDETVYQMSPSGEVDDIGRNLEPIITAFPKSRLENYVVGAFYEGRYYLSMDNGVSPVTYIFSALKKEWTRIDTAYSCFTKLSNPHDTDFSGLLSIFMAGDDSGFLWQLQESSDRRTSARLVSRADDGGDPYSDKLWRSLRIDAAGTATGHLFLTSGQTTNQLRYLQISGSTRTLLRQGLHGESLEMDMHMTTDGSEFKIRGYFLEVTPRPLR